MESFRLGYRDKHKQGLLFAERVGEFRSRRNRADSIDVGVHKIALLPTRIGKRCFNLSVEDI